MKKKIYIIITLSVINFSYSQVGINTESPQKDLDINGDLNLRNELRVGGTDTNIGSAGNVDDIFYHSSNYNSNLWKRIVVADGEGSMAIKSVDTTVDNLGLTFIGYIHDISTTSYQDGASISGWHFLVGNEAKFSVTKPINRVVFSFQTVVQKKDVDFASFACGIFVDDKLRAARVEIIRGDNGATRVYNINSTLENFPQKKDYIVKIGCRARNLQGIGQLGVGTPVESTYLNQDMARSSLTVTVLEPY